MPQPIIEKSTPYQQVILTQLQDQWGEAIQDVVSFRGEITIMVKLENLHEILDNLKNKHKMFMLLDISSIDHLHDTPRFEVVYELANINDSQHIRIKVAVKEGQSVPTTVNIWKTANWHEREIYDMMGIEFSNHPEMTRILMWEGYKYYPLRKDFPLAGIESDIPEADFIAHQAPLEGGPFVTTAGTQDRVSAEPCAKGES